MSTNRRIFMLSDALKKMPGCEPDIICITQITCEFVNAMLIYKGRLGFYHFEMPHEAGLFTLRNALHVYLQIDYVNRFSHPKYFHSLSDHYIKLQLRILI